MFTPAVMTIIYVLIPLLLLTLIAVRVWKWRQDRPVVRRTAPRTTDREPIVDPTVTDAFHRANGTASAAVAGVGGAARKATWEARRLFAGPNDPEDDRPPVDPERVPAVDRSDYVLGRATPAVASLLPESEENRQQWKRDLRAAGYLSPRAWQNFAATRYLLIVVPLLVLGVLLLVVPPRFELFVIIGLILLPLLGWALPALHVRGRRADRVAEIERGMPDLIDMLNMCVSQGLTVLDSLRRIRPQIAEAYPALATELGIIIEQAKLGSLRHALENFADRVESPEVRSFVNLLTQTERMGTSVSEALTTHSDGVRETLRQRADEKANRASFRLLFPTALCLMPAVYLILMGPAVNELTRFFEGEGATLMNRSRQTIEEIERPQILEP